MPKVSVVLTSYNHAKYISEAIESVLNQTFADLELIILDDASTDTSWSEINRYSDPRVRAFRGTKPNQVAYRLNEALTELATGEYVAIHHSDDIWALDKLEKQVSFLDRNSQIAAVFTNALAVSEDGSSAVEENHLYSKIFDQPNRTRYEWLRRFFLKGNALCLPSVLMRRTCYESCGLFRAGLAQLADFDLWIRICLKFDIHVLAESLIKFRVRDNEANTSGNRPEVRVRASFEYFKIYSNYLKVESFAELCCIFPECEKYDRGSETNVNFALAMTALELKPLPYSELFALDILFGMISDPAKQKQLIDAYDFDHQQFATLTALHNPFQVLQAERLASSLAEIEGLRSTIREMQFSHSWRITAPFRWVGKVIRRLRKSIT